MGMMTTTPCEDMGFKVGDKFVVNSYGEFMDAGFEEGQVITLFKDEGSMFPLFKGSNKKYKNADGEEGAYLHLPGADKIEETTMKDKLTITLETAYGNTQTYSQEFEGDIVVEDFFEVCLNAYASQGYVNPVQVSVDSLLGGPTILNWSHENHVTVENAFEDKIDNILEELSAMVEDEGQCEEGEDEESWLGIENLTHEQARLKIAADKAIDEYFASLDKE